MADIQNYELDIDLKQNLLITVTCKQLDNLNLVFNIWNDGQVANLSDYTCRLKALKSDQIPLIQDTNIIISNNVVKINCNSQLTTATGVVKAELQFINKTTKEKKTSFNIEIDVIKSTLEVDRSISKATYDLLQELEYNLDKVEDLEFNFIEADKLNKELKNTTTPNANKINTTLEENINKANTKKNELDGSINNANNSKQALDIGNSQAITNKKNLDESNVQAVKNLDALGKLGDATDLAKDVETLKEQVLENTYTKIETDSTLTKLPNSENGFVHNMQILGKTLQNLADTKDTLSKEAKILVDNKYIDFFKPNTTYTYIFDVILNTVTVANGDNIGKSGNTLGGNLCLFPKMVQIPKGFTGNLIKASFTTPSVIDKNMHLSRPEIYYDAIDGVLKFKSMCLEGDWTNKEIPPYFEGIKSVGEAEENKISILTCGKNLFDIDKAIPKSNTTKTVDENSFTLSGNTTWCATTGQKLILKSNTKYKISGEIDKIKGGDNVFIEANNNGERLLYTGSFPSTFTTKNDVSNSIITFVINNATAQDTSVKFSDIQIEEDTPNPVYEPYKEDKTTILLSSPHMGLPDGTNDIIYFDKSERIKNINKKVFDGGSNENWILSANQPISKTLVRFIYPFNISKVASSYISDKFKFNGVINLDTKFENEGIYSHFLESQVNIIIDKSKLETPDLAGFKKLLKSWADAGTPLEVYYQLANPVTEKLNIKDELQTFKDGYIQLDNAITPNVQLEYSTNLPSIISRVVENQDRLIDRINRLEDLIITKIATNK